MIIDVATFLLLMRRPRPNVCCWVTSSVRKKLPLPANPTSRFASKHAWQSRVRGGALHVLPLPSASNRARSVPYVLQPVGHSSTYIVAEEDITRSLRFSEICTRAPYCLYTFTRPIHTAERTWYREIMASVSSLDQDMRNLRLSRYTPAAANETRAWIEDTLGEKLPSGDLLEALKDGVALCK